MKAFSASLGALALVAGCSSEPVGPAATLNNGRVAHGWESSRDVTVCKVGPAGSTATFAITATGGVVHQSSVTVNATPPGEPTNCTVVWSAYGMLADTDPVYNVTVSEIGMTAGTYIESIGGFSELDGWLTVTMPANSITVRANHLNGAMTLFKNAGEPEEPGGFQGCTPGYWKQSQHFDSWTAPYAPGTLFGSVFADAFPGKTLLQVLKAGGGGLNALGRHTVAALLNTAGSGVAYGMTTDQVISAFNAAFASGDYEGQKNIFEAKNEAGCPLN